MTKFNPENKIELTYRECLGPAMEITDPEDAKQYFNSYVEWTQKALDKKPRDDSMTAEQIAKVNLGYYAGYYDNETRLRVQKLFTAIHPIFGNAFPTAKEAFNKGVNHK